jgi:hypothetical protein
VTLHRDASCAGFHRNASCKSQESLSGLRTVDEFDPLSRQLQLDFFVQTLCAAGRGVILPHTRGANKHGRRMHRVVATSRLPNAIEFPLHFGTLTVISREKLRGMVVPRLGFRRRYHFTSTILWAAFKHDPAQRPPLGWSCRNLGNQTQMWFNLIGPPRGLGRHVCRLERK